MFALSITRFIQEFCRPHNKVALTSFMHDITFGKGQISMLVSSKDVFLFYSRNKIPMLCTDESGRTLAEGVYINRVLEEQYRDCAVLMPLMVSVGQQFGHNFGRNSLHVVARENDCQHLYSLFFDLSEPDFLHWVINNGGLLQDFIANYNFRAKDIILEAKQEENRIILPNFNPAAAVKNSGQDTAPLTIIHHKNKLPIYLSSQQSRCLRLLMKGKSAKEIGQAMKLSHRTVEHYLDKIRKTLGCASNKELVVLYFDQLNP